MKRSLSLLFGVLILMSFVFGGYEDSINQDTLGGDVKIGSKDVLENISEQIGNLSINTGESIDKELPSSLQFIDGVTTFVDLIIYIAFFVVILCLVYELLDLFSNKKGIRVAIASAITLLISISGAINQVIAFYIGFDLRTVDIRSFSWKLIGTVFLGFVLFFVIKWFLKKTKNSAEKDSMWGMGLKIRKQEKIAEAENKLNE